MANILSNGSEIYGRIPDVIWDIKLREVADHLKREGIREEEIEATLLSAEYRMDHDSYYIKITTKTRFDGWLYYVFSVDAKHLKS